MSGNKPKFDKQMCLKCKWHGTGVGYPVREGGHHVLVHCNYSLYNETTPLRVVDGKVIDLRGEDRYGCQLFEKGKPDRPNFKYTEDEDNA